MREGYARAKTISIGVRHADLGGYVRQTKLSTPTNATSVVARAAWTLLVANEALDEQHPLRALNVRASDLIHAGQPLQLSLFDEDRSLESEALDSVIDDLRRRYGNTVIQRGIELADTSLAGLDIKRDNIVHPVGFFHA